jgi:hypothetical protein
LTLRRWSSALAPIIGSCDCAIVAATATSMIKIEIAMVTRLRIDVSG